MGAGIDTIPPTDLTTAAIDAVNLILSALGISPLNILESLFSGRPEFEDTDSVIAAYNQSAYWPLHALAAQMQIWVKNGAPISDSNPQVQASFGVAKQGTVTSIQSFAGVQPGPGNPGYWTIFALIEQSWAASQNGEQAVLQYVKALDALTQVLAQQYGSGTQPPPSQPPATGPTAAPCPPYTEIPDCIPGAPPLDHTLDEIGNAFASVAYWLQVIAIYLMNIFQNGPGAGSGGGGNADPVTCTQLTGLIGQLVTAIGAINIAIPAPPPTPEPPPPIDLTAIDADLKAIATALENLGPFDSADLHTIAESMTAADALSASMIEYFAGLGIGDPNVDQLASS